MPQLPPCFPYCQGSDGKRNGQHNLPYRQQCQNNGNGDVHNVDYNYEFSPCFPFCNDNAKQGDKYALPPCFPFCNRQKRLGSAQPYSPCHTCHQ